MADSDWQPADWDQMTPTQQQQWLHERNLAHFRVSYAWRLGLDENGQPVIEQTEPTIEWLPAGPVEERKN